MKVFVLFLLVFLAQVFAQNPLIQSGQIVQGSVNPLQTISYDIPITQSGLMIEVAGNPATADQVVAAFNPIIQLENLDNGIGTVRSTSPTFDGNQGIGFACPTDVMVGQNMTIDLQTLSDFTQPYMLRVTEYDPSLNGGVIQEGIFCCQNLAPPASHIWSYDITVPVTSISIFVSYATDRGFLALPDFIIGVDSCPSDFVNNFEFDIEVSGANNIFTLDATQFTPGQTLFFSISQPAAVSGTPGSDVVRIFVCADEECNSDTIPTNPLTPTDSSDGNKLLHFSFFNILLFVFFKFF